MNQNLIIWKYQARMLLRNKQLLIGVFILVAASLFGVGYGKHFVQQQNSVIYSVDTLAKRNHQKTLEAYQSAKVSPGFFLYASEIAFYHPSPLASLAIGQKDNYPFYHNTGMVNNVYGVTTTDIQNPIKLLVGNFDLSYVFLYLFPLFIIVFGYNVLAEEREKGTLTLLKIQGNAANVLLHKLAFRLVFMLLLSLIINLLAFNINGISWKESGVQMISWILITMLYIFFWFSIVYFVVSINQSGAISALLLSGAWILFLILIPSIIHRNHSSPQEKEQVQSIFNSRGDYQRAYKLDSTTLVDSFSKLKHPYSLPSVPDTGKLAKFYRTAMAQEVQVRHDNNISKRPVLQQANEYENVLAWNWLNPVFATQNAYNQVAQTEINNYHNYLEAVEKHQTKKRYFINNLLLSGKPFNVADAKSIPRFSYKARVTEVTRVLGYLLPLLLMSLLLIMAGSFCMKNMMHK